MAPKLDELVGEVASLRRVVVVGLLIFVLIYIGYLRRVSQLESELQQLRVRSEANYSFEETQARLRANYREDIARGVAEGVQPIVRQLERMVREKDPA